MTRNEKIPAVRLPKTVAQAIIDHAREGKPEEVCGILRGRGMDAYELYRARNVAAERIENYTVDPQILLLQFAFEEDGDEMMGIYHSHPLSEAYPSATDAWNAHYPDSIYLICSLADDQAPVIRAFRLTTQFLEMSAVSLKQDLAFYETRPGLFAFFQPAGEALPACLGDVARQSPPPFYVVFQTDSGSHADLEVRAVSVEEYPVRIG